MSNTGGRIDLIKQFAGNLVVEITRASGQPVVVYSDAAKTVAVSMPDTITAGKSYFLRGDDTYVISAKINGIEIASADDTPVSVQLDMNKVFAFAPAPDGNRFLNIGPTGAVGPTGPSGPEGDSGSAYYGQIVKTTSGTITIAATGDYQSTGLTATLDSANSDGISLGSTDEFAIKNTSGKTIRYRVFASMDCSTVDTNAVGIKLALNGVPIDESDCRAWALQNRTAKLVTSWIVEMEDDDEVALFVANISEDSDINFIRGRIVASSVGEESV
jgi:hypothetical protein